MATLGQLKGQAALAGTEQKAKLRRAITLGVRGAAGALAFLLVTVWIAGYMFSESPPATPKDRTPSSTRAAKAPDPCDNQYRKYHLTMEPARIVAAEGCRMGWDILQGEVILIGPGGVESRPITNNTPLPNFHGVKWRAHTATALVEARFYR